MDSIGNLPYISQLETNNLKNKLNALHVNTISKKEKFHLQLRFNEFCKKYSTKEMFFLSMNFAQIWIVKSTGCFIDDRVCQRLVVLKNKNRIAFSSSNKMFVGQKYFPINAVCNSVLIDSTPFAFVLLSPKAAGTVIHEICHMLENDYYVPENPVWHKFGSYVASEKLTIYDAPSVLYNNEKHIDDEGVPLEDECLIKDGKLQHLMGCQNAKHTIGEQFVINRARRESYRNIPTGRSFCSVVPSKEFDKSAIIQSGLFCNKKVLVINDFKSSFVTKSTFEICCSTDALFEISKTGQRKAGSIEIEMKGSSFLFNIVEICNDPEYYENMCNSSSGYVSSASFVPSIIFKLPSTGVLYSDKKTSLTIRF